MNSPIPAGIRRSSLPARVRRVVLAGRTATRPAPLVELALLVTVVLLFSHLHAAAGHAVATATANASHVQSVERTLHIGIEPSANRWLAGHPALTHPAVYYYRLYYVGVVGVLAWVFLRHGDLYVRVRRPLVAMMAIVLLVFWALPTSPPRFALPGIVDVVALHDAFGGHATRHSGQNLYSSMPSMHMGWTLWCGYAAWSALRRSHPRLALLPWLFPLGMAAVVLTTGNHYVLDIVGSVVLLTVSIGVAGYLNQYRTPPLSAQVPRNSVA